MCFVSAIPNSLTISLKRCNILLTRNATKSASLAKAMQNAAKPLVICGPSGVGKSSIVQKVQDEFPDCFGLCVSHTTRKPRENEKDGVNYHFVKKRVFLDAKERGEFIETVEFAEKMYGTSRGAITQVQKAGLICILDIEIHGVQQIKKTPGLDPHYVFITPPSIGELEVRLRARKTETEDNINKRLERAAEEIEYGTKTENFDLVITNDTLDNSASKLRDFMIVHIEELKRVRKLLAQK
jgi:guanylate kinase